MVRWHAVAQGFSHSVASEATSADTRRCRRKLGCRYGKEPCLRSDLCHAVPSLEGVKEGIRSSKCRPPWRYPTLMQEARVSLWQQVDTCVSVVFQPCDFGASPPRGVSDTSRCLAQTQRSGVAAGHGQHSHDSVTDGGGTATPSIPVSSPACPLHGVLRDAACRK